MTLGQVLLNVSALVHLVPLQFGDGFIKLAILFLILAVVAVALGASGVSGLNGYRRVARYYFRDPRHCLLRAVTAILTSRPLVCRRPERRRHGTIDPSGPS